MTSKRLTAIDRLTLFLIKSESSLLEKTMDRRNFLSASLTASALSVADTATAGAQSPANSPNAAAEYYDLRRYQLVSGPGTRLADNYFAGALIPALIVLRPLACSQV